jgi:uncharacterized protein YerC
MTSMTNDTLGHSPNVCHKSIHHTRFAAAVLSVVRRFVFGNEIAWYLQGLDIRHRVLRRIVKVLTSHSICSRCSICCPTICVWQRDSMVPPATRHQTSSSEKNSKNVSITLDSQPLFYQLSDDLCLGNEIAWYLQQLDIRHRVRRRMKDSKNVSITLDLQPLFYLLSDDLCLGNEIAWYLQRLDIRHRVRRRMKDSKNVSITLDLQPLFYLLSDDLCFGNEIAWYLQRLGIRHRDRRKIVKVFPSHSICSRCSICCQTICAWATR